MTCEGNLVDLSFFICARYLSEPLEGLECVRKLGVEVEPETMAQVRNTRFGPLFEKYIFTRWDGYRGSCSCL